ncbi:hypothetical protein RchiOBHm_Chr1g0332301 [Rosa chinensis]|uniref:Uncharacterized protein n=1 Tax=Rosa chinensis TaxID=74649 RepID=A0A2P6SBR0_ROSCH|nr:hypothetical protein RchiOBHm_Chr1g0332301 [Rosa chinensis]
MFVAGMNLLSKAILSEGSFIFALMEYRHVVAAICVALRSLWKGSRNRS